MLTFALWKHPTRGDASDRIYINGLPRSGKAWFQRTGKENVRLTGEAVEDEVDAEQAESLILAALVMVGIGADSIRTLSWSQLLPVTSTPKRGTRPVPRPVDSPMERMARGTNVVARPGSETLDFSKVGIKEPGLTVYADHREPQAIIDLLRTVPNLTVEIQSLPVGDFVASDVIIERKVVRDLEQSIMNGRMFDEANRIGLERNTVGVVLIEGDVFAEAESLLAQNLIGAITCLSFVQGMSVWTSLDYRTTAYAIAKVAQHASPQGLGYELALRKTKPKELLDEKRFICQGLPGVSGGLAVTLLEHFGSLRAIANASAADLMKVKGLGPKTADRIVAALS